MLYQTLFKLNLFIQRGMLVCAALYEVVADIVCQAGTKGPGRDSLEEHLFEVLAERGLFFMLWIVLQRHVLEDKLGQYQHGK